jgi:hypothetical protein
LTRSGILLTMTRFGDYDVNDDVALLAERLADIADAIRGLGGPGVVPEPEPPDPPSGTWVASGNPTSAEVERAMPTLEAALRNTTTWSDPPSVVIEGRLWVWHAFEGEHSV